MAKNAPFHIKSPVKNFHGRAKGGASHRGPPLKYATDCAHNRSMARAHIRRAERKLYDGFQQVYKNSMGKWIYDCSILKGRENFCIKHITRLFDSALPAEINAFNLICNF